MSRDDKAATRPIEEAARELERTKQRLASTLGALQYRLKPGTRVNSAWEGVREKSGEVADTTLQSIKDRPLAVSGVVAGILVFIARDPLKRYFSGFFPHDREAEQDGTIQASLDHEHDYDLTAPTVARSKPQGVKA